MKHKQFTLPNKIEALHISHKKSPITFINVTCKVGSKNEDKTNLGISHFLEHMFFKGTKTYPNNKKLTSEIESLGGIMNAFTSQNTTSYIIKIPSTYTKKAIEILSDMLYHSLFRKKDIEYEKNIVITELKKYEDDPYAMIQDTFNKNIFKDTPLEKMPIGTIETIRAITRSSLLNYKNKFYTADNFYITITSNVSVTSIQNMLEQSTFMKFKSTDIKKHMPFLYSVPDNVSINSTYKDMEQDKLIIGFSTCAIHHNDKHVFECIKSYLTGGLSSVLFVELREKQSLVYDISSGTEYFNDVGLFYIQTGMDTRHIIDYGEEPSLFTLRSLLQSYFTSGTKHIKKGVVSIILNSIIQLRKKKISAKQLRSIVNKVKSAILFDSEDIKTITHYYANQLLFNKHKITSIQALNRIYDAITPEDIVRVSKKYFTKDNLFVSVVGKTKQSKLETFLDGFKRF